MQYTELRDQIAPEGSIKQTEKIYEGNNSVTVSVQSLQPGIYTMQMSDGNAMVAAKFSILR